MVALLAALLMAGCNWSQFRGDAAHTGYQPSESKIGPSTVSSLAEAWTAQLGPTTSSPVVAGGRLYIGEGGFARAEVIYSVFDAAGQANCSGTPKVCRPLWQVEAIGGNNPETPAVANGLLYVNLDIGFFAAYNVAACEAAPQCAPVWVAEASGTPVVSGGVVYADSFGSVGISAYDAAGTTNCAVQPGGTRFCEPMWTTSSDSPVGTVAVAGGVAYASSFDGTLYAYDAAGQHELRRYTEGVCTAVDCVHRQRLDTRRERRTRVHDGRQLAAVAGVRCCGGRELLLRGTEALPTALDRNRAALGR